MRMSQRRLAIRAIATSRTALKQSVSIVHQSSRLMATLDSGAMEHVTGSVNIITNVTNHYSTSNPCPISLWNASNTEMTISHKGDITPEIRGVLVSPDCDSTLMSATKFQADGFGIWLPPHTATFKGGIIYRPYGPDEATVVAVTDVNMQYNIFAHHESTISIPSFHNFAAASRADTLRVKSNILSGISRTSMTVSERVCFAQKTFLLPYNLMLWSAINWPGFPVSEYEVRKHFCRQLGFAMGHNRRPITSNSRVHDTTIEEAIDAYNNISVPKSTTPLPHAHTAIPCSQLYPQKLIPGETIYSDIYCGAGNMFICTFDDAATGFSRDSNMTLPGKYKSKKSYLPQVTEEYLQYLQLHGKHSKTPGLPVANFVSDSEAVYKSHAMNSLRTSHGIFSKTSPPDHKEYSPAECNIQNKGNLAACMAANSRHMHESFYPSQWHYANKLRNDRPSRIPGHEHLSRRQDFLGDMTDLSAVIRLPHGQPVMFREPSASREKRTDRMHAGSFIDSAAESATEGTAGAIVVYSHASRRIVTTDSFEIVAHGLSPLLDMPRSFFTTNGKDMTAPYIITHRAHNTRERARVSGANVNAHNPLLHLEPIPVPAMPPSLSMADTINLAQSLTPSVAATIFSSSIVSTHRLAIARQITSIHQLFPNFKIQSTRASPRLKGVPTISYNELEPYRINTSASTRSIPSSYSSHLQISMSSIPLANEGVFATSTISPRQVICDFLGQDYYFPDSTPHRSDFPTSDAIFEIPQERRVIVGNKAISYGPMVNCHRDKSYCNAKIVIRNGAVFVIARESFILKGDEILASYAQDDTFFTTDSNDSSKSEPNDNDSVDPDIAFIRSLKSGNSDKKQRNRFNKRNIQRLLKMQRQEIEIEFNLKSNDEQLEIINNNITKIKSNINVQTVGNQRVRISKKVKANNVHVHNDIDKYLHTIDNPCIEAAMMRSDAGCFAIAMEKEINKLRRLLKKAKVKNRNFDSPTLTEAKKRGDWVLWSKAIQEEFDQMLSDEVHGPAIIGQLPHGANLIGTMWVLKIKRNSSTGEIEKYKARLVALGNQQKESSFDQIKSITARGSTVKMIMSIQAKTGAMSMVLDVKGAYLKSSIQEDSNEKLYIRYPNGKIHKLNKYLYGLKQAGYEWQKNVTTCLIKYGYVQSTADPMVFTKHVDKDFCIMSLHVDDFYVISSNEVMLQLLHQQLSETYGTVSVKTDNVMSYLGMEVKIESNGDIIISQPAYIKSITDLYNISGKRVKTPMVVNKTISIDDDIRVDQTEYLTLVGALSHIAQYTRPDILFAVSCAAQKCSKPNNGDMKAVLRIFQYLSCTLDLGIRYSSGGDMNLVGSVDASHNQYEDGRGHYGYSFSLGRGNGSFDAKSSKMKLNTLSSTESEYVAFCEATREAIWLRRLLSDMGFPQVGPTIIYEDNTSTIQMLEGAYNHKASKHVNPRYHFSKSAIVDGEVSVEHLVTTEMESDMLTKALPIHSHWKFAQKVMNFSLNQV
jgi:hypothetical protein